MRVLLLAASLALLAPVVAALPATQVLGNEVTTGILGYSPAVVVIPVGGSVTWVVHESFTHTVTGILGTPPDSGDMVPVNGHAEYTATFTQQGVVPYHCLHHPWMVGVVVVG